MKKTIKIGIGCLCGLLAVGYYIRNSEYVAQKIYNYGCENNQCICLGRSLKSQWGKDKFIHFAWQSDEQRDYLKKKYNANIDKGDVVYMLKVFDKCMDKLAEEEN